MKKWTKRNRVFLNAPASGCFAGVAWSVALEEQVDWRHITDKEAAADDFDPKKKPKKWVVDAHMEINREALEHYVSRKANLRALKNMQRELNRFVALCEKALRDAEKANAKS
jgi:hypothetical protein